MAQNEGYPTERYPDWFSRNLIGLLFAAHTNTAGTFAWTLAHIGSSSKFQDCARTECKSVLASTYRKNSENFSCGLHQQIY